MIFTLIFSPQLPGQCCQKTVNITIGSVVWFTVWIKGNFTLPCYGRYCNVSDSSFICIILTSIRQLCLASIFVLYFSSNRHTVDIIRFTTKLTARDSFDFVWNIDRCLHSSQKFLSSSFNTTHYSTHVPANHKTDIGISCRSFQFSFLQ